MFDGHAFAEIVNCFVLCSRGGEPGEENGRRAGRVDEPYFFAFACRRFRSGQPDREHEFASDFAFRAFHARIELHREQVTAADMGNSEQVAVVGHLCFPSPFHDLCCDDLIDAVEDYLGSHSGPQ